MSWYYAEFNTVMRPNERKFAADCFCEKKQLKGPSVIDEQVLDFIELAIISKVGEHKKRLALLFQERLLK